MLEKVFGKIRSPLVTQQLIEGLDELDVTGTLYLGYPVLASADETIFVEALLICAEHGLVVFSVAPTVPRRPDDAFWATVQNEQDKLYFAITNNLGRYQNLRRRRELAVRPTVLTFFPDAIQPPRSVDVAVASPTTLANAMAACESLPPEYSRPLNAALQRVSTIKPAKKRTKVTHTNSRGAILKEIEREIANLDQWQKRAAIESPEGPQRVRGLAGSGKTVVLALKAAYLHAQNPDWNIVLTFYTRSLYQQLTDLVRRFSFEHANDEPNWDKLKIIHAWGSSARPGVYVELAAACGAPVKNFLQAKSTYGMRQAFHGVCSELASVVRETKVKPIYDAVLIDEAQDLPWPFFQLIYEYTRDPRRIIWAYDELQNLTDAAMPSIDRMFGMNEADQPRVQLANVEGQPRQDIILPVCYRNSPWALTLAHSLGFGIYRDDGLVQLFDDPSLWSEVGYTILSGSPGPGSNVVLKRAETSYPNYFHQHLREEDAIICRTCSDKEEQAEALAENIHHNLTQDELETDDILIILPNAITARKEAAAIAAALAKKDIQAHVAGVTTSQDQMFSGDSVAISSIFRAKGNEAPMVYVPNCQHCAGGHELITLRNILFTAITRSRAWVRLFGYGPRMEELVAEVEALRRQDYRLSFSVPSVEELDRLRMIHRERTASERDKIRKVERGLAEFVKAVESGDIAIENLPPDLQRKLRRFSSSDSANGND